MIGRTVERGVPNVANDTDDIADIATVRGTQVLSPPVWAVRQREILAAAEDAAVEFVDRYTRSDGTLMWRSSWPGMDGSDDPYEAFQGLPLLYLLGGGDRLLELARRQWDAVTWQWTEYGQIHREFDGYYDWMHHGEANHLFQFLGMADPESLTARQRAARFAGLYVGDDPGAPNYDPRLKLIRSPLTGSRGPRFVVTAEDWSTHREDLDFYPPPFEDIPGVDGPKCQWTDDTIFAEILDRMNARMTRGDVPLNLITTTLVTHAFLLTGSLHYRDWVLDYNNAWQERTRRNGGIIPDNIGLDDVIGQYMDGKWWGGYYGWRWPHGAQLLLESVAIAGINATLLDGRPEHLDLTRSQLDAIWTLGHEEDQEWVVPHRRLDSGWSDYRPLLPTIPIACWSLTHDAADLDRVLRLTDSTSWGKPTERTYKANGAANSEHWFAYIHGKNPDYPQQILDINYGQMQAALNRIRTEHGDPADWGIHHWQNRSPIFAEGLVQTMLGAPMQLYHGGLQLATFRYYDASRQRPGLPLDVAALVEHVDADGATVHLVNCSATESRDVIMQAGAFGEHSIVRATTVDALDAPVLVEHRWLRVSLDAGAQIRLRVDLRRFANVPSYDTPWTRVADLPPLIQPRGETSPAAPGEDGPHDR